MDPEQFRRRFATPAHEQWRRDRALRQRIPLRETWRGCLGLAAFWDKGAPFIRHGDRLLIDNNDLSWVVLRDVPPGHHPAVIRLDKRDVNWASVTQAKLRFGLPCLNFRDAERSFDFRSMPMSAAFFGNQATDAGVHEGDIMDSANTRLFELLNAVSGGLTEAAFFATDGQGRPMRAAWARHRPSGGHPFVLPRPESWMPGALVGVPAESVPRLYAPVRNAEFRQGFARALAAGMPLRAPAHCVYAGSIQSRSGRRSVQAHALRLDGGEYLAFHLPSGARLRSSLGQELRTGELWCEALPAAAASKAWQSLPGAERSAAMARVCGGSEGLVQVERLWLSAQSLRLDRYEGLAFYPAELVAPAVCGLEVHALVWDLSKCQEKIDPALDAVVFPPLRLSGWDKLRTSIGVIDLNAEIGDPRFCRRRTSWREELRPAAPPRPPAVILSKSKARRMRRKRKAQERHPGPLSLNRGPAIQFARDPRLEFVA